MSTSMLASKMQSVANEHNLPIEVEAFPDGKIGQIIDEKHPDVILLGPRLNTVTARLWKSLEAKEFRYRSLTRPITV